MPPGGVRSSSACDAARPERGLQLPDPKAFGGPVKKSAASCKKKIDGRYADRNNCRLSGGLIDDEAQ